MGTLLSFLMLPLKGNEVQNHLSATTAVDAKASGYH
jgi:hypothetical protein